MALPGLRCLCGRGRRGATGSATALVIGSHPRGAARVFGEPGASRERQWQYYRTPAGTEIVKRELERASLTKDEPAGELSTEEVHQIFRRVTLPAMYPYIRQAVHSRSLELGIGKIVMGVAPFDISEPTEVS
jgi:hypothetical protein